MPLEIVIYSFHSRVVEIQVCHSYIFIRRPRHYLKNREEGASSPRFTAEFCYVPPVAVGKQEGENGGRFKGNGTNDRNSFARVITHEA